MPASLCAQICSLSAEEICCSCCPLLSENSPQQGGGYCHYFSTGWGIFWDNYLQVVEIYPTFVAQTVEGFFHRGRN